MGQQPVFERPLMISNHYFPHTYCEKKHIGSTTVSKFLDLRDHRNVQLNLGDGVRAMMGKPTKYEKSSPEGCSQWVSVNMVQSAPKLIPQTPTTQVL